MFSCLYMYRCISCCFVCFQARQGLLGDAIYLTLLVQYGLMFLCVFRRVKDPQHLPHCSQLLKKTCVRQVVLDGWLDRWFPLGLVEDVDGRALVHDRLLEDLVLALALLAGLLEDNNCVFFCGPPFVYTHEGGRTIGISERAWDLSHEEENRREGEPA